MNRLLGLGVIILMLLGCQQEATKTGVVGQQFILKADFPNEVGTFDYIWKITDLPEGSELMLSDIQFSEDESQAIFIPDVIGHFTIQVTVWKYNDKLGAYVYNYDISEVAETTDAQQPSNDAWLNETVDMPDNETPMTDNFEIIDTEKQIDDTKVVDKPATKVPPTASIEPNFTIQVAAESTPESAQQHVNRLIRAGYDAYSLKYTTPNNNTVYRIRIGKFATKEDALQVADRITNSQGLSTWVTQYQK